MTHQQLLAMGLVVGAVALFVGAGLLSVWLMRRAQPADPSDPIVWDDVQ